MTYFWISVTGMLSVALLFIFWPLLAFNRKQLQHDHIGQKQDNVDIFKERLQELENEKTQGIIDQEAFTQLRTELEKSLLSDVQGEVSEQASLTSSGVGYWWLAACMSVLLVGVSLAMYYKLGRSEDYQQYLAVKDQGMPESGGAPEIAEAIKQLEQKVQQDPSDMGKWYLLANSYSAVGQFGKSAQVFAKIAELIGEEDPNYATVKGSYAQAVFMDSGEQMTQEVKRAADAALALDPLESNALILRGIDAYQLGDYQRSIDYWQLAKQKAGESQQKQFIDPAIQSAQARLGIPAKESPAAGAAASVTVNLAITPALKKQLGGDKAIFVYVRPAGQRMPLAAERLLVKDLPARIVLDDSKAVMPAAKLSSVDVVDITARISLTGQAMAQPGDPSVILRQIAVANDGKSYDLTIGAETVSQTQVTSVQQPKIKINLDIAPEFKGKVSGNNKIFVFARAVGGRMPLAVERLEIKDLPAIIELDDSNAVMPTAKLSSADKVEITARVSFSGQAMPQPGDLYAAPEQVVVANGGTLFTLLINQVAQ